VHHSTDEFSRPARSDLRTRLAAPVDIAGIAVFRIVFGAVMLWEVGRYLAYGWVRTYYLDPPLHFTYWGFEWVRPLPHDWMYGLFVVLGILALAILLGVAYRLSIVLFTFGFAYWFLLEKARYQNHFYLIGLLGLILCCIPANAFWSIDSLTKPHLRRRTVPAWMLWLLRFQIAVPFFFGGIAKITPDWLHGEPMRTWLAEFTMVPIVGEHLDGAWAAYLFSYGGLLFDLLVAPLLLWRKTRPWAYAVNVLFHLANSQLFHIGIFPWFLIGATTIFFDPAWPRALLRRFQRRWSAAADPLSVDLGDSARPGQSPLSPVTVSALFTYVVLQCLIPLWHYRYPGVSAWTMEGHFFAWHMRLSEKVTGIRFRVTDPVTGQRELHDPNQTLPRWQVDAMSTNPEMIRQYSHFLAQRRAREGGGPVEVRATVLNSLNGRKPQPLIDPNINLAETSFSWRPYHWIAPLREPRPGNWRPDLAHQ
jgi:hypothetical protein